MTSSSARAAHTPLVRAGRWTWWWARWFTRYFPAHAWRRLRFCRREHRGPWIDGVACLTCAAPWFRRT